MVSNTVLIIKETKDPCKDLQNKKKEAFKNHIVFSFPVYPSQTSNFSPRNILSFSALT